MLGTAILLATSILVGQADQDPQKAHDGNAPLRSFHLFNLPPDVTEQQVLTVFSEVNRVIADLGYGDAGYRLWKVQTSLVEGKKADYEYRYVWEGSWPNRAAYDAIHKNDLYKASWKPHLDLVKRLMSSEVYLRCSEIKANTEGSGR